MISYSTLHLLASAYFLLCILAADLVIRHNKFPTSVRAWQNELHAAIVGKCVVSTNDREYISSIRVAKQKQCCWARLDSFTPKWEDFRAWQIGQAR